MGYVAPVHCPGCLCCCAELGNGFLPNFSLDWLALAGDSWAQGGASWCQRMKVMWD